VRDAIVAAGNARVVAVGSPASDAALAADLAALVGTLDRAPRTRSVYPAVQPIGFDRRQALTRPISGFTNHATR